MQVTVSHILLNGFTGEALKLDMLGNLEALVADHEAATKFRTYDAADHVRNWISNDFSASNKLAGVQILVHPLISKVS